jgi:hypothetical protein
LEKPTRNEIRKKKIGKNAAAAASADTPIICP